MDDDPSAVIERALVRIRRAQQSDRLRRTANPRADAARFRYLDALDGAPEGRPISQVADAIGVDRPRASRLTTDLAAEGLVEREPDPGDSRYTNIRLTTAGRALVNEVRETRRAAVGRTLSDAGFSEAEAARLAELLTRFLAAWPGR